MSRFCTWCRDQLVLGENWRSCAKKSKAYVCVSCNNDYALKRLNENRRILIEEAGGLCLDCNSSFSQDQFEFHHRVPEDKSHCVDPSRYGMKKCRTEAKKCDLLCIPCHRTRHKTGNLLGENEETP